VKQRHSISALRGLACLLLVLYHIIGATPDQGLHLHAGWLRTINDALGTVRMPLFAFIAGAVYAFRPGFGMAFIRGKFRRLIIPMLIVGTAFALLQSITPGANRHVQDWSTLHLLPVAHFWFLESLFLIFVLVSWLERWAVICRPTHWLAVFAFSAAVYVSGWGLPWFGIAGAVYLLPFFLLGLGIERFGWKLPGNGSVPVMLLLLSLGLATYWAQTHPGFTRLDWEVLAIGLVSSTALWFLQLRSLWLEKLGVYSYSIFLFHVFFTAAIRVGLDALGVQSLALQIIASLIGGTVGPMCVYRVFARSPRIFSLILGGPATRHETFGRGRMKAGEPGTPAYRFSRL